MDQPVGCLVTEVTAPVGDTLMDPSNDTTSLDLGRTRLILRELTEPTLGFGQDILIGLEEPLTRDFETIAGHDKNLQTHVEARNFPGFGKGLGFVDFHGEAGIPLICLCFLHSTCFDFSDIRSVENYWDSSDLRQVQCCVWMEIESKLFVGHGVIPPISFESRVSGFQSFLDPLKKSLVCQIDTNLTVLHDLGKNISEFWFVLDPSSEFLV